MTDPARALYHIQPHKAHVLLGPIAAELATLEARLAHYHDRLRMEDADRAAVARARDVVTHARAEVSEAATTEAAAMPA